MTFPTLLLLLPCAISFSLQGPGDRGVIPGWHLQSTQSINEPNLTNWSLPGADVSSWHRVRSRATILAGLVANNVYNETNLFYSDNLSTVNQSDFQVPWLYREEFSVPLLAPGQHLFLMVHGISSKADIFLNGGRICSAMAQRGSYGGKMYDLTPRLQVNSNALLIQAYPTNYLRDLAVGFGDWNPRPPDNGTGVWRNVDLKLTGPVTLSSPRIITNFTSESQSSIVAITVRTTISNHENAPVDAIVQGTILPPDGSFVLNLFQKVHLSGNMHVTVSLDTSVSNPEIWWPAEWGSQSLYQVNLNVSLPSGTLSDIAPATHFGIRRVISVLNSYNDTLFSVNGHPFRVRGAGYAPDIFLRFDLQRLQAMFQYVLDLGLNTIRLEGKQEHPELYDLADRMGLMVMAGWECCDKWEGWEYDDDADGEKWHDEDYPEAYDSMLHEAEMMQAHPSLLAFLVGSDYWPNNRATDKYLSALHHMDWPNPVIAAASKRGHPEQLGPSGMKMDGPYDWVPPNYWYGNKLGAAFGFGSEQGAGVGTPELGSLRKFLSPSDLEDLWASEASAQYHLSPAGTVFQDRRIYNRALVARYGRPKSLKEYVRKAQVMDYEATRAEFEAFAARQNASRPATGVVYWMLNTAWPSLHWQLFDYYLRPAGAYFGVKASTREEHVVLDYGSQTVYLINHSLHSSGSRRVLLDLVGVNGTTLLRRETLAETIPTASKAVLDVPEIGNLDTIAFLRLVLENEAGESLSRNVYWISSRADVLDWDRSTWYSTPVSSYADFTALASLETATVHATALSSDQNSSAMPIHVVLENRSTTPAFFLRLALLDAATLEELVPVFWSDNYVTLLPQERISFTVKAEHQHGWVITMEGMNVEESTIARG
ncbi:hypothetical protein ARAM_001580 [Aspergillus rambellii]|uniref:Uncharacterized protein n=1 Tax=Aspergillus rambellii TaxID=308745 RepID=A0A0F8XS12_9EURO|nr:hypothetical protein ARAM_001580 [Aspergillus rambellii]